MLRLADVRLAAPIPEPGKIVCVGQNYAAHVREQGGQLPERPLLFAKFANAVVGDGDAIVRHAETHALDLETELAVVVGRRMRRVAADGRARARRRLHDRERRLGSRPAGLAGPPWDPGERGDGQWLRAKGSDTFCPLGPALVTADEVRRPGPPAAAVVARPGVRSRCRPVGTHAGRAHRRHDLRRGALLAFVSDVITLEPGRHRPHGTPAGVGVFREPPVFLEPGDVVAVEVEGIGRLVNPVVDHDGRAPAGSPAARMLAGDRPRIA